VTKIHFADAYYSLLVGLTVAVAVAVLQASLRPGLIPRPPHNQRVGRVC